MQIYTARDKNAELGRVKKQSKTVKGPYTKKLFLVYFYSYLCRLFIIVFLVFVFYFSVTRFLVSLAEQWQVIAVAHDSLFNIKIRTSEENKY